MKKTQILIAFLLALSFGLFAQVNLDYQTPPQEILELANKLPYSFSKY